MTTRTTLYAYCRTCQVTLLDRDIRKTQENAHFADASETNLQIQKDEHTKATGHTEYTKTITLRTKYNSNNTWNKLKTRSTL